MDNMSEIKWQVRSELIVYRAADSAVLLLETPTGWVLPCAELPERVWIRPGAALNQWVAAQLGMATITLNCASFTVDREGHREETTFVMEVRGGDVPQNGRFFPLATLPDIPQQTLLQNCLQELATPPALRPLWLTPGWFDEAATWITAELTSLGYTLTGAVEQVSNWVLSAVLRAPTTAGAVYFKAVADMPLFVNEPVMVQKLARLFPHNLPHPLAIEPDKRWMLMTDFGTDVGEGDASLETLIKMVQEFGRIQAQLVPQVAELLQMGCLDRRLARLAEQLDELLADEETLQGIETAEIAKLRHLSPRLKQVMAELAAYHIPQTLMHGDLHLGNVALRDKKMLFFDWTDACITHPFMDMMVIYEEPDEAKRTQLRDAYLQEWTAFEPMERLLAAWKLVESLWPLHQAISYQYILANLEDVPRKGFGKVVSAYLELVVKSFD